MCVIGHVVLRVTPTALPRRSLSNVSFNWLLLVSSTKLMTHLQNNAHSQLRQISLIKKIIKKSHILISSEPFGLALRGVGRALQKTNVGSVIIEFCTRF